MEASSRGDIYSYIICPACVHGPGTGPVGRVSGLAKFLSYLYTAHGGAFVVGDGTNFVGAVSCIIGESTFSILIVFFFCLALTRSTFPILPLFTSSFSTMPCQITLLRTPPTSAITPLLPRRSPGAKSRRHTEKRCISAGRWEGLRSYKAVLTTLGRWAGE